MQNDFKLVKKKRQRKERKGKLDFTFEGIILESQTTFNRKFEKALEEFKSSRFAFELVKSVDNCINDIGLNCISEILCYGLGSFFESKSSLHQLAALVVLQKKYNSTVNIYDPVFSNSEVKALNELHFNVLSDNEEGKRRITNDKGTLVFLPHCPKQLVNNFLWANWNTLLCKCLLITNSFRKIVDDNTQKVLQKSANYILKIHKKTIEIPLEDCYNIENVFNDMSIHYFRLKDFNSNFFSETLDQEPNYLEETELVTKKFGNLDIKNEF